MFNFFPDLLHYEILCKVFCVFAYAIYFCLFGELTQPSGLNSRVTSSVKSSLSPLTTPSSQHLCTRMLHTYLPMIAPIKLYCNCTLYFIEVLISPLCLVNKIMHISHWKMMNRNLKRTANNEYFNKMQEHTWIPN